MADIYVRSSDGNNADNGSTWALAKATIAGAAAIAAAGDTVYVSDNHSESTAGAITITWAGTIANPIKLLCVDDAGDPQPPTALATTAQVATTVNNGISLHGSLYTYGITFTAGNSTGNPSINLGQTDGHSQLWESCNFYIGSTGASGFIRNGGNGNGNVVRWVNCNVKFGNAGQRIYMTDSRLDWRGGGIAAGGTSPVALLRVITTGAGVARLTGVDLSQASASINITDQVAATAGMLVQLVGCLLPSSWSGVLIGSTPVPSSRVEMVYTDSANTNYRYALSDGYGDVTSETTIVRTGGASDGTTPISHKMVTAARVKYPSSVLVGPDMTVWNETTGSAMTLTVEVITDNVTLNDDECWVEVDYLGASGSSLGSRITDAKADVMASAAAQASSSVTWTTTGLTTPTKQKLAVTFTPQKKGPIIARVALVKASTTVYVDPVITLS